MHIISGRGDDAVGGKTSGNGNGKFSARTKINRMTDRSTNRTTGELDVEPLKLLELTRVPVVTCHREGCYGKPSDVDSWRSLNS